MADNRIVIMSKVDVTHREEFHEGDTEKEQSPAYVRQPLTSSHHKTAAESSLVLKADLSILPLAALVYFVSYIGRNNIGNARLMGLQKSLRMSNNQYYDILSIFFVGYIIFILPANVLLRRIRPHRMLGFSVIVAGMLVCCSSAVKTYHDFLALRILIGCSQSLIQGLGLYTSYWYKRDEVATRGAIYYSAATISGAFSGLIAYGVQKNLTGFGGRAPWEWLFIIEGSMALFVGLCVWLLLPPFPDQIKNGKHWLFSESDIVLAKERARSYNTLHAKIDVNQILAALKDPKSYVFAFINAGNALAMASVGIFLPTFINGFGFTPLHAQLFSVIPYACAFATLLTVNIVGDRLNMKGFLLLGCLLTSCCGYIILLAVNSPAVKIFASCLVTSGVYPAVVLIATWLGINTGGYTKRATTWAMAEIFGNCFSIMGSHVYTNAPKYVKGHTVVLAFLVFSIFNTLAAFFWMKRLNSEKDQLEQQYQDRGEAHPDAEKSLEDVYDFHIAFRYTL